jgi:sec-independent protein translocase protein TatC
VAIIKDIDDREMPLLDHLIELRNRLVYSAVAILAGFLICYVFADDIYLFWSARWPRSTRAWATATGG